MVVWQVGAGDAGRDYSRLCLEHDLMCVGPGYGGFADGVREGDLVLLRRGHLVIAIGLVPARGYRQNLDFDDIYGWNLEHTRRVIWQHELDGDIAKVQDDRPLFSHMKEVKAFARVNDEAVLSPLRPLFAQVQRRALRTEPDPPSSIICLDSLADTLSERGCDRGVAAQVHSTIARQKKLLRWYEAHGEDSKRPTEHEVVAYMILPLLKALGWLEERLAVEWQKVDVAGFYGAPSTPSHCVMICEAKRHGHGLQNVLAQAIRYVTTRGLAQCRQILVADGRRFYLYERTTGVWPTAPTGYFNIDGLRSRYLMPRGADAIATLLALRPPGEG